jgi:YD repeat-containing protein
MGRGILVKVFFVALLGLVSAPAVLAASNTISYEYDELGRLTKVTQPDGSTVAYTLDATGNREEVKVTVGGGSAGLQQPAAPVIEAATQDVRLVASSETSSPPSQNTADKGLSGDTATESADTVATNSAEPASPVSADDSIAAADNGPSEAAVSVALNLLQLASLQPAGQQN